MGRELGGIPPAGVRPSDDDDGNTLARSERQLRHWPKKAILIEGINRPHGAQDSTSASCQTVVSGAPPAPSSVACSEPGNSLRDNVSNSSDSCSSKSGRPIQAAGVPLTSALSFGCVGKTRPNIFGLQLRELLEDQCLALSCRQVPENVANRTPA